MKKENVKKVSPFEKRIHEIDFLRGFLMVLVIMDHLFINLAIYSMPTNWNIPVLYDAFYSFYWKGTLRDFIQPLALMAFCFVSGISCAFSRNNWKRAIETIILAALISGGSHILVALNIIGQPIDVNIIGVLGLCMLLYCFVQKRSWKGILAMMLGCFLMASYIIPFIRNAISQNPNMILDPFVDFNNNYRPGGGYNIPRIIIPIFWEPIYGNGITADYVPLFPYAIGFFGGALFSYFIYKEKKQSIIKHKGNWEKPICFLGRHSLIFYLAHMVVIMGVFNLINLFVKG